MSRKAIFETAGVLIGLAVLGYAVGDVADLWQMRAPYALTLCFLGMMAFRLARRSEREAAPAS